MKSAIDTLIKYLFWIPSIFSLIFFYLLYRAKNAFSAWPKYSTTPDPHYLVNNAPKDSIHHILSYDMHLEIVAFLLFVASIILFLGIPYLFFTKWYMRNGFNKIEAIQLTGFITFIFLMFFEKGRFIIWYLD